MQSKINKAIEIPTYVDENKKSINVCAYCRVSTNDKDQANSFESQKKFFEREFDFHGNWKKKHIFADKGISGTSLNHRDEFNKMIRLALNGEYDLIITKEVSRFSRNVKDLLNIVGELRKNNVYVYFMSDEINTQVDDYGEKLATVGLQAEAESRRTSKRVKWGQQRKMEQGVVFGRREMLGYNIIKTDQNNYKFEIIPKEAEIVEKIFKLYAKGKGTFQIARLLEQEGIKTKRYKNGWSNTVILRVLRNEKYVGDLFLGKTYTPDCLTHKKVYNKNNVSTTVYHKNHHPKEAIISRKLWNQVQARLKENEMSEEVKAKHSNRFWCSGKVFCGICGQRFVSHNKKLKATDDNGNNIYRKRWTCWEQQNHGRKKLQTLATGEVVEVGCTNITVSDEVLKTCAIDIIESAVKPMIEQIKDEFLELQDIELNNYKNSNEAKILKLQDEIESNKEKRFKAFDEYNSNQMTKSDYDYIVSRYNEENARINEEIEKLKESDYLQINRENEIVQRKNAFNQLIELKDKKVNEEILHTLIDKILVYPNNYLEYYFYFQKQPVIVSFETKGRLENYQVYTTVQSENKYRI